MPQAHKGRGAISYPTGRFESRPVELDAHESEVRHARPPATVLTAIQARSIISHNSSPDVPFDRSINPYQGCEHGCIYCYARPSHSYLDLSPGLDFESKIFYKSNAVGSLLDTWSKKGYVCEPVTIGANTDPYQPAEKSLEITRQLLGAFLRQRHPVNLITKSHLVLRDLDILRELAQRRLCSVAISIPTMDDGLKRLMEPRVPSAEARLRAIESLSSAGVPVSVLVAPVIPAINDGEIERILGAVAGAGALRAHYIFLRLPHELKAIFVEWLECHFPERSGHVMSLVRQASGGRHYDHRYGHRQRGKGPFADMLRKRFELACKRYGLEARRDGQELDCSAFERPGDAQLGLDLGYS